MIKKEIRKNYLQKRISLTVLEKSKLDDLLLIQFQTLQLPFLHTVFSFWPIEEYKEPNVHLITDYLQFRNPGMSIAYPRIDASQNLIRAIVSDEKTNFKRNKFNIHEPENGYEVKAAAIDLVIVPLLAFDKYGYRVGYGKGYYDKFLSGIRKECIKVGFSCFEPVDKIADTHEFDVPLSYCITPQTVYVF
jgi:5-formyltetrahydrofolate cyclo-ligase